MNLSCSISVKNNPLDKIRTYLIDDHRVFIMISSQWEEGFPVMIAQLNTLITQDRPFTCIIEMIPSVFWIFSR